MAACCAVEIFCLNILGFISINAARCGSCQIGYFRIMSRAVSLLGQPTRPDGQHAPAVSLQEQSYIFPFDASGTRRQRMCASVRYRTLVKSALTPARTKRI